MQICSAPKHSNTGRRSRTPSIRSTTSRRVACRTKSSTARHTAWCFTSTVRCSTRVSRTPRCNFWSLLERISKVIMTSNSSANSIASGRRSRNALWWLETSYSTWTRTMCPSSTYPWSRTCSTVSSSTMWSRTQPSKSDWFSSWSKRSGRSAKAKLSRKRRFVAQSRCWLKFVRTRANSTNKSLRRCFWRRQPSITNSSLSSSSQIHPVPVTLKRLIVDLVRRMIGSRAIWIAAQRRSLSRPS